MTCVELTFFVNESTRHVSVGCVSNWPQPGLLGIHWFQTNWIVFFSVERRLQLRVFTYKTAIGLLPVITCIVVCFVCTLTFMLLTAKVIPSQFIVKELYMGVWTIKVRLCLVLRNLCIARTWSTGTHRQQHTLSQRHNLVYSGYCCNPPNAYYCEQYEFCIKWWCYSTYSTILALILPFTRVVLKWKC